MKKRFLQWGLALMLSSAMMTAAVPMSAFAEEETTEDAAAEDAGAEEGAPEEAPAEDPGAVSGDEAMPADAEGGEEAASAEGSVVMTSLTANNGRMIASDFPDSLLPEGFHKTSVQYQGENVQVAFMDNDPNGEVVLAYLADSDGSNGDFYLCDINTANMTDYVRFSNGNRGYIIILDPEDKVAAPSGFTRAKLESGGKIVNAWQLPGVASGDDEEAKALLGTLEVHAASAGGASSFDFGDSGSDESGSDESGSDESSAEAADTQTATEESDEEDGSRIVDADPAEFFLAYAIDNEGTVGFYLCDSAKSTFQRYVEIDENNGLVDQYKKTARTRLIIIIVLVVLLLIAIFLLVNMFLQGGFGGGHDRDDDDDVEQMRRRVSRKEQDHIRTGRKEMNYLMDKDDEEEDDMPRRRQARPADGERPRRRPADGEAPRRRPADGEAPRRRPAGEDGEMPRRRPARPSMEDEERPVRRRTPVREEEGAARRRPVRPETEDDMPRRRVRPSAEDDMMPRRRPARPAGEDAQERVVRKGAAPTRRPSASVLDEEDFEYDYLK